MTKIFQHRWPVWKDEEDTSIFVNTQPDDLFGDEYKIEEILAQALGDSLYKICAIPLLVHDINLGDVVRVGTDRAYNETITDGCRFGFRLAINTPPHSHDDEGTSLKKLLNTFKRKNVI